MSVIVTQAMIDDFVATEKRHPQDAISGVDIRVGDEIDIETIQPEAEGQTPYQRIILVKPVEIDDKPAN